MAYKRVQKYKANLDVRETTYHTGGHTLPYKCYGGSFLARNGQILQISTFLQFNKIKFEYSDDRWHLNGSRNTKLT